MYARDKGAHFPLTILTYSAEEKRKPLQNISTYHMKAKVKPLQLEKPRGFSCHRKKSENSTEVRPVLWLRHILWRLKLLFKGFWHIITHHLKSQSRSQTFCFPSSRMIFTGAALNCSGPTDRIWLNASLKQQAIKGSCPEQMAFLSSSTFRLYCLIYKSVQLQTKVGTTCTQKKSNHVSIRILARAKEHDCKAKLSMMEFVFARGCFSKTQTFETCVFRYECQRCLIRIDMPAIIIPKLTYWLSNMSKQRPRVSLPWGGWPSAWPRGVGKIPDHSSIYGRLAC